MEERLRDAAAFAVRCGEAVHARPDGAAGQGGPVARDVRRPPPGRDVRHGAPAVAVVVDLGRTVAAHDPRHAGSTSDAVELDPPVPDGRRRCARPPRRAPVLARGPAAPGDRRGHRAERGARRDLPGAARGCEPPRRGDAGGRAGHRQDAPAARRRRARLGERVHLRRHHRRRGDPRTVPRRAEPVRLERDPRHGRGNAGGGGGPAGGGGHLRA